jgi:hypothetical protein
MLRHPADSKLFVALMLTSVTWSASSAFAQSQANRPDSRQNDVAAEERSSNYLKNDVETLKAENAVVRELLRKMEEQQKALLEQVDRLQRRLDGVTTAVVQPSGLSQVGDAGEPPAHDANAPGPATNAGNASGQQASVEKQATEDHYQDGIIIWRNPEDAKVPFLLKFNNNTQIRYLNTLNSKDTFTDHLGVVRDVHTRNDITVNRSMFIFALYSLYRGYDRLGADDPDGTRLLRIMIPRASVTAGAAAAVTRNVAHWSPMSRGRGYLRPPSW